MHPPTPNKPMYIYDLCRGEGFCWILGTFRMKQTQMYFEEFILVDVHV